MRTGWSEPAMAGGSHAVVSCRSIEVPSRRRASCIGNPLSKIRSTLGPSAVDRCRPTRRRPNDDRRFKDDSRRPVLGYAQRGDGKGRTAHLPLSWTQDDDRSEEHTSELQSLMRISYAVFCL